MSRILSTVWLTAFVRETDAANVSVGQDLNFSVMALPYRPLTARISYVATAIDPARGGCWSVPPSTTRTAAEAGDVRPMSRCLGQRSSGGRRARKQALITKATRSGSGSRTEDKSIELRQISPASSRRFVEVVAI